MVEAAAEIAPLVQPDAIPVSLTCLVIDDKSFLAEALHDILCSLGHEAAMTTSGAEGLALLADRRFDIVLTDLGMPGMSGWDVAMAVKAGWPELPVILVTGWGDTLGREGIEGTGVDLILTKPYTIEQLTQALAIVAAFRASSHSNPPA